MLYSMTGYGRILKEFSKKTITVEIKSLNSKFLDIKMRLPQNYRNKELDIRRKLSGRINRGKIDMMIEITSNDGDDGSRINQKLFKSYYEQLQAISSDLNIEGDLIQTIVRLPNIVETGQEEIDKEEWNSVLGVLDEAIEQILLFRRTEGEALEKDLKFRVDNIQTYLGQIVDFEGERKSKLLDRLRTNFEDTIPKNAIDENRFEQEILYYLEKMDITEEKIRLSQHCEYFKKEMAAKKDVKGKKLNFISQEMGREINTIGSKANHSGIQHLVVQMKDDLEKIKEQLSNIL